MDIKTPGNVLELIENLFAVFKNRYAFDETFYTEDNIIKLTAAQKIRISRYRHQENPRLEAGARDFRAIVDNLIDGDDGLSVSILLEIQPDGKKSVIVRCNTYCEHSLLYYPAIEKLIGHTWQPKKPDYFWCMHRGYQRPTDLYGNQEREYVHQEGGINEKGVFKFDPAGLLSSLFLHSGEQ